VCIEDAAVLPPPEELRDLTLEDLLNILTSARPINLALLDWIRRHPRGYAPAATPISLDPLKRFDTSALLLQRTRRFSMALTGLRQRLEAEAPTREAFSGRLNGPVGPRSLLAALKRERQSDDEYAFLHAEVLLELSRVHPQPVGAVAVKALNKELRSLLQELEPELRQLLRTCSPSLKAYIRRVRAAATRAK
jgi:hypothetical protein